uniref:Uncharacterized protein n=1 Tax=Panagrolaimus sp. JU765 TaxID=591449 RepID=A0AC34QJK6_9BILA
MPRTKSRIRNTNRVSKSIPEKSSEKCIQTAGTSKNINENSFHYNDRFEDDLSSRASTSISTMELPRPRRSKTVVIRYSPPPKQAP